MMVAGELAIHEATGPVVLNVVTFSKESKDPSGKSAELPMQP